MHTVVKFECSFCLKPLGRYPNHFSRSPLSSIAHCILRNAYEELSVALEGETAERRRLERVASAESEIREEAGRLRNDCAQLSSVLEHERAEWRKIEDLRGDAAEEVTSLRRECDDLSSALASEKAQRKMLDGLHAVHAEVRDEVQQLRRKCEELASALKAEAAERASVERKLREPCVNCHVVEQKFGELAGEVCRRSVMLSESISLSV